MEKKLTRVKRTNQGIEGEKSPDFPFSHLCSWHGHRFNRYDRTEALICNMCGIPWNWKDAMDRAIVSST